MGLFLLCQDREKYVNAVFGHARVEVSRRQLLWALLGREKSFSTSVFIEVEVACECDIAI